MSAAGVDFWLLWEFPHLSRDVIPDKHDALFMWARVILFQLPRSVQIGPSLAACVCILPVSTTLV